MQYIFSGKNVIFMVFLLVEFVRATFCGKTVKKSLLLYKACICISLGFRKVIMTVPLSLVIQIQAKKFILTIDYMIIENYISSTY